MAQRVRPIRTEVKVVPRDGEIHITLDINVTVDGDVAVAALAAAEQAPPVKETPPKEKSAKIIPGFTSGMKLNFGKKV